MNSGRRALVESVAAAVSGYIVAAILEAGLIAWVRPTEWELAWVSDAALAVALESRCICGGTL
jgi:site-specific recombinase